MKKKKEKEILKYFEKKKTVEVPGIEPRASHMQSARSTTELHPLSRDKVENYKYCT